MLAMIMVPIHALLMAGVMALTYEYYDNLKGFDIPDALRIVVYVGVLGVSILWALGHALVGMVMGVAAGGVLEGLSMGLKLGIGLSVGRLWPYVGTFAVGAFLCGQDLLTVIGAALVALVCFAIDFSMRYIWSTGF